MFIFIGAKWQNLTYREIFLIHNFSSLFYDKKMLTIYKVLSVTEALIGT